MSDYHVIKQDLSAAAQASIMVRNAALPVVAGSQVKAQINQASIQLRLNYAETKRLWYAEKSLKADYFLLLKQKYENFIDRKITKANSHMLGELALLEQTQDALECKGDEKQDLQDNINDLREAITCLGAAITRLSELDGR